MKAALLILCFLAGCKAHFEEEARTHASVAEQIDAAQHVETHVEQAAGRTTTTVEEFAQDSAAGRSATPGSATELPDGSESPVSLSEGARQPPQRQSLILARRTVTVEEHGAVTTDTHVDAKSQERADSIVDGEHKSASSFDFLHSPFALLGGLVALAGVAFAAFKILKPRLLP